MSQRLMGWSSAEVVKSMGAAVPLPFISGKALSPCVLLEVEGFRVEEPFPLQLSDEESSARRETYGHPGDVLGPQPRGGSPSPPNDSPPSPAGRTARPRCRSESPGLAARCSGTDGAQPALDSRRQQLEAVGPSLYGSATSFLPFPAPSAPRPASCPPVPLSPCPSGGVSPTVRTPAWGRGARA